MTNLQDIWRWIKLKKRGIIFGASLGVLAYFLMYNQAAPLFAVASPSISDKVITIATKSKYLISLIFIGATMGAITDGKK